MAGITLERAAELRAGITPRPWHWAPASPDQRHCDLEVATGDDALWGADDVRILTDGSARGEYSPDIDIASVDAQWIAASPEIYDLLVEEIARLNAHIKDLNHDVQAAVNEANWQHRQGEDYGTY